MKFGDISNEPAPTVGIRFERIIKTDEGKLNMKAKGYLQSIWRLDINIAVITTGDERKALSFLSKWGVPYNRIIRAIAPYEVADVVRANDMVEYYDVDKDVLQNVISRGGRKVSVKEWTYR